VLVVDDDQFALRSMVKMLGAESYEVVAATSGSEAIDLLKEDTFDLVLTDLKMPEVNGMEVLRQAREITPQAVVLILTGYASLESGIEALREGAYDYLAKPCSDDELKLKIERGLERVRLEKERLRAEDALWKSERRYRLLAEHATDVIWTMDMDLRFTYVSPSITDMLGYSVEEVMAQTLEDFLTPASFEVARESLTEALVAVEPEDLLELELNRKDGSTLWTESRVAFLRDPHGQPVEILGVTRDITERKRAEEALRKAHDELEIRARERTAELAKANEALKAEITRHRRMEEALQESHHQLESRERFITSILDSIPTSLVVIDRTLRMVSVNRNFLEKTQRDERATLGRKIEDIFPQVLLEYTRLDQRVREVFRTGQPVEGGKLAYRAPGLPTRIYYYRLIPLYLSPPGKGGEGGEVENVMLLMDDITEREKLGEEVRRAERHLASIVECANDLVASMDPAGRILTWNRAAEDTSGYRPEELKGQYLADLCVEQDQQKMRSWLAQLTKGQFTKKSVEISLGTKGGKEIPISWAGSRMLDDERRIVGLVAVGRDLTERKRLEAQLIQSAKLTSLGVMAGGIAHEIRNPLAISSAAAQLLLERPEDEEFREEAAEKIHSGVQRASYIIENLLKFARPPEERMVAVDIGETLEETLSLLANQLRVHRIELRKEFAPALLPVIGNKSLLQQVFSNMILNACNAMPDGGSLTVVTQATKAGVEIQFSDTGCGISPEHLPKIFDPFFTTMPVGKGVGLGLSISYSIIQQHQGTIEVRSVVGKGTTFTVRLPADST
jgi:PAS domain S-box-containing protein